MQVPLAYERKILQVTQSRSGSFVIAPMSRACANSSVGEGGGQNGEEDSDESRAAGFFCQQNQMSFRELPNGLHSITVVCPRLLTVGDSVVFCLLF